MMERNKIAGTGQHSHEVPTVPNLVVEMRDAYHDGTAVYLRTNGVYVFADLGGGLETHEVPRVVLVVGHSCDEAPDDFAMDCTSPRGLILIGIEENDDLSWLAEGAEVIWDSKIEGNIPQLEMPARRTSEDGVQ